MRAFNFSTLGFLVFFHLVLEASYFNAAMKSVPVIDRRIYYGHVKQRLVPENM